MCNLKTLHSKTLKFLLFFLVSIVQIPVLPIIAFVLSHGDRDHQVIIEERRGVITLILQHAGTPHTHGIVVDLLIKVTADSDSNPDHRMSFAHSEDYCDVFRGQLSCAPNHVVAETESLPKEKIPTERDRCQKSRIPCENCCHFSAIPRGLRETVMLL